MIDHVSITVADIARARPFYDAIMAALGHPKVADEPRRLGYGLRKRAGFDAGSYMAVFEADLAVVADRRHWCFTALSRAAVDRFHEAALANGGRDDGAPGPRPDYHPHYYGAFVLDLDGNRLEAAHHQVEQGQAVLTLERAQAIVRAALAGPRSDASRRIALAVVDGGGHLLALAREEGAAPLLAHIAEAKAQSCVAYGKPTRLIQAWAEATPAWFEGVSRVAQSRLGLPLIGSLGGVLILGDADARIGAVGVAGEAGQTDEALAVLGIGATQFKAYAG